MLRLSGHTEKYNMFFFLENYCPDIKRVANKHIVENENYVPQTWLRYIPTTNKLNHNTQTEFFSSLFGSDVDKQHI